MILLLRSSTLSYHATVCSFRNRARETVLDVRDDPAPARFWPTRSSRLGERRRPGFSSGASSYSASVYDFPPFARDPYLQPAIRIMRSASARTSSRQSRKRGRRTGCPEFHAKGQYLQSQRAACRCSVRSRSVEATNAQRVGLGAAAAGDPISRALLQRRRSGRLRRSASVSTG